MRWAAVALIRVTAVDALIHIELTYFLRVAICVLLAIRSSNAGSVIDAALERRTATVIIALALNTLAIVGAKQPVWTLIGGLRA